MSYIAHDANAGVMYAHLPHRSRLSHNEFYYSGIELNAGLTRAKQARLTDPIFTPT